MPVKFVKGVIPKIATTVKDKDRTYGVLLGYKNGADVIVTECINPENLNLKSEDFIRNVESFFPAGIDVQAVFTKSDHFDSVLPLIKERELKNLRFCGEGAADLECYEVEGNTQRKVSMDIISKSEALKCLAENMVLFHINESLPLTVIDVEPSQIVQHVHWACEKLEKKLLSENVELFIPHKEMLLKSSIGTTTISNFLDINEKKRQKQTQAKVFFATQQILNLDSVFSFSIFENITGDSVAHTPVITHKWTKTVKMPILFNLYALVMKDSTTEETAAILRKALTRQLVNTIFSMEAFWKSEDSARMAIPRVHQFCLPNSCHPVAICYPGNKSDSDLMEYRRSVLHTLFMEPPTRPLFTRLNCLTSHLGQGDVLLNTHEGLRNPSIEHGEVTTVSGIYGYHHYMQDRFDDNGWGCAYRSLQTIVSWFQHQGYTDQPIPSHREIQQALVDVGDKPKEFVGSKKWIGSIEINNILNHLYGITSKIMFVSRGSELSSKGRELACHFQDQGTPVMIGGGVLAHTILGVCFSEVTGETRFLILDPHYTGSEDLKTIQTKGWCGWKSADFWNQTAYYNLCLPQRPVVC